MAETPMDERLLSPLPLAGLIFMPAAVGDCTGAFMIARACADAAAAALPVARAPLARRGAAAADGDEVGVEYILDEADALLLVGVRRRLAGDEAGGRKTKHHRTTITSAQQAGTRQARTVRERHAITVPLQRSACACTVIQARVGPCSHVVVACVCACCCVALRCVIVAVRIRCVSDCAPSSPLPH